MKRIFSALIADEFQYCIYELICPETMAIMYVGMSKNPQARFRAHQKGDEKSTIAFFKKNKLNKRKVVFKIRMWGLSKSEAIQKESEIIEHYKGIGMCSLNTYIGHTPLTKKPEIKLLPRQVKMKATRRAQCQSGAEKNRLAGYNESRKKAIVDQFGNTYESIRDCERKTGCHRPSIGKVLRGEYQQTNGYVFRRANA